MTPSNDPIVSQKDFFGFKTEMFNYLDTWRLSLGQKVDYVAANLETKITTLGFTFESKLDALSTKTDYRFENTDRLLQLLADEVLHLREGQDRLEARIGQLERRQDQFEAKLDLMGARLTKVETRLDQMDSRISKVESRLDKIESRLDNIEAHLDKIDARLDKVESRLDKIEITLSQISEKIDRALDLIINHVVPKLDSLEGRVQVLEKDRFL